MDFNLFTGVLVSFLASSIAFVVSFFASSIAFGIFFSI
jgi:hypothetical protein